MKRILILLTAMLFAAPAYAGLGEPTDYGANECLGGMHDSTVYLGLFTAAPSDGGGGTEVSGNGYARQSMTLTTASAGAQSNSAEESFTASGGNFGTLTHWGVFDASTSGNLLWWGALDADEVVNDGSSITFPIGSVDLGVD